MRTSTVALAGLALGSFLSAGAWAFPAAPVDSIASSNITLAADKCGRGNHRDEHGVCVRDDRDHCGRGWHWHEGHGRCER
jgi:hypothetical protein